MEYFKVTPINAAEARVDADALPIDGVEYTVTGRVYKHDDGDWYLYPERVNSPVPLIDTDYYLPFIKGGASPAVKARIHALVLEHGSQAVKADPEMLADAHRKWVQREVKRCQDQIDHLQPKIDALKAEQQALMCSGLSTFPSAFWRA